MIEKPNTLYGVWSEKDLCGWLDLPVSKSGHSRQLSHWIKGGLPFVEKADRRYFFEQDVINYLWNRLETNNSK